MAKFRRNRVRFKNPPFKRDSHEFVGGKKGILVCKDCDAVYYKKFWHHSLLELKSVNDRAPLDFTICPACKMIKNHQFEGEIRIVNIPPKLREDLIGLIEGFCERARARDPMDRLIEIKSDGRNLVVTVTENELANKLAKKIKSTFNKVKTGTSFIKEPGDITRVMVEFI